MPRMHAHARAHTLVYRHIKSSQQKNWQKKEKKMCHSVSVIEDCPGFCSFDHNKLYLSSLSYLQNYFFLSMKTDLYEAHSMLLKKDLDITISNTAALSPLYIH